MFEAQHPNAVYSRRKYEILNWPEDVDVMRKSWRTNEIEKIREKMSDLIFAKRSEYVPFRSEFGLDKIGNLKGILDNSMTKAKTNIHFFARRANASKRTCQYSSDDLDDSNSQKKQKIVLPVLLTDS